MESGSLTIVGTGIQLVGHLTLSAQAWIKDANKVLFALSDPVTAKWLQTLNPIVEPLPYNRDNQRRRNTYQEMVEYILTAVRQGGAICVVFYGHPGVFSDPAHDAIKRARQEGFHAQMLPGISAADCLFADLGVDPGRNGCQSFEATDFLIRQRQFDCNSSLVLWQIAMIGELGFFKENAQAHGLSILTEVLEEHYDVHHEVIIYEAATYYPICQPVIRPLPLSQLPQATVTEISTLYIPPRQPAPLNKEMVTRLGMFP